MYSQNQSPTKLPFKVLATNDVIEKESIEIEKMGKSTIVINASLLSWKCLCAECHHLIIKDRAELRQLCLLALQWILVWLLWVYLSKPRYRPLPYLPVHLLAVKRQQYQQNPPNQTIFLRHLFLYPRRDKYHHPCLPGRLKVVKLFWKRRTWISMVCIFSLQLFSLFL